MFVFCFCFFFAKALKIKGKQRGFSSSFFSIVEDLLAVSIDRYSHLIWRNDFRIFAREMEKRYFITLTEFSEPWDCTTLALNRLNPRFNCSLLNASFFFLFSFEKQQTILYPCYNQANVEPSAIKDLTLTNNTTTLATSNKNHVRSLATSVTFTLLKAY
jgi:hypothetical protein